MYTDYKFYSDEYIRSQGTYEPEMFALLHNLSAFVCDIDGKMTLDTSNIILKEVTLVPPNIIVSDKYVNNLFEYTPLIDESKLPFKVEEFVPKVSSFSYNIYINMQNNDSKYVFRKISKNNQKIVRTPLFLLIPPDVLNPNLVSRIRCLYLELYAVYTTLLQGLINTMSNSDIDVMLSNAKWIKMQCEPAGVKTLDLVSVLSDIESSLSFLRISLVDIPGGA